MSLFRLLHDTFHNKLKRHSRLLQIEPFPKLTRFFSVTVCAARVVCPCCSFASLLAGLLVHSFARTFKCLFDHWLAHSLICLWTDLLLAVLSARSLFLFLRPFVRPSGFSLVVRLSFAPGPYAFA